MMKVTVEYDLKNPFKAISDLHNSLGVRKIKEHEYLGIVATGDFEGIYDYARGFLSLSIRVSWHYDTNTWHAVVHIGCVDDGDWSAWGEPHTKEDSEKIVEEIHKGLKSFKILPTEEELNNHLAKYKLFGQIC